MRKVYVQQANEGWIVDWMFNDFAKAVQHRNDLMLVKEPLSADVIWLLADWCWDQIPKNILAEKRVITTIHHIVPETFKDQIYHNFKQRDEITDIYHVFSDRSRDFLKKHTEKPIVVIKYWVSGRLFGIDDNVSKFNARSLFASPDNYLDVGNKHVKFQYQEGIPLPIDGYIVGSFQRDTLGNTINTGEFLPKLEKGPDIFCDYVIELKKAKPALHVLLGGWRRQYVIKRLIAADVPFTYYELIIDAMMSFLYRSLDLYVVSSRCEGGPQALLETGYYRIPTVSTPVGIAEQVLPSTAISQNCSAEKLLSAIPAIPNVQSMMLKELDSNYFPKVLRPYVSLLVSV